MVEQLAGAARTRSGGEMEAGICLCCACVCGHVFSHPFGYVFASGLEGTAPFGDVPLVSKSRPSGGRLRNAAALRALVGASLWAPAFPASWVTLVLRTGFCDRGESGSGIRLCLPLSVDLAALRRQLRGRRGLLSHLQDLNQIGVAQLPRPLAQTLASLLCVLQLRTDALLLRLQLPLFLLQTLDAAEEVARLASGSGGRRSGGARPR